MHRCGIGRARYDPVKGVNFADQMPLSQSPDRGVTGHRTDLGPIERQQRRARPASCCGSGSFAAGVAAANYDYIKMFVGHAAFDTPLPSTRQNVPRGTMLFADTESRKNAIQHRFDISATSNAIERVPGNPQLLGQQ